MQEAETQSGGFAVKNRLAEPGESEPVSVIVGAFNCADFLPGLWACLEAQTFRDFEIVVVDDASTDGKTLQALEAMGDRIRLIRRQGNSRTCELPRYQGAKAARGSYCAFMDADDRWDPEFLKRCFDFLETNPGTPLVHTAVRVVDGQDQVLRIRHDGQMPEGPELARDLLRHCSITVSAVMVHRQVWLDAVPEERITDFGMDADFFLAIARHHPVGFIPEVLASYRRSEASISTKKWRRSPRNVNTMERFLRQKDYQGLITRREMKRLLAEAYYENAEYWLAARRPDRAFWFAARGLRVAPLDKRIWRVGARAVWRLFGGLRSEVGGLKSEV